MENHNLPSPSSCPSTSASISYAHNNSYVYHVFINHRGPDCKKTLATDLYNRLRGYGLRVFLDQQELQEGDALTSQIKGAIEKASVHIAIFSEKYAQSNWCLDELVLMFQSRATILPVFYGSVKPSHLRWLDQVNPKGQYATYLLELQQKTTFDTQTGQNKPRYSPDTVKEWRQALSQAAQISGFELEKYNGEQHHDIQRIVERVLKKVIRPVHVAKYPIGLDLKMKDFETAVSLEQQSSETRVIGIVGLGGVGKTTLANEIFNRRQSKYDRACYLSDVNGKPFEFSQRKLLQDLAGFFHPIADIHTGIENIKTYLASSRSPALLILDNVDHINQLNALFVPVKDNIAAGSLILITSRNKDVLINSGIEESFIYELKGLDRKYSQELFCSHAFGQPNPGKGFERVVENFLDVCHGLPLSLQVIGASLYGQEKMDFWVKYLKKISKTLPDDITGRLKISYDGLDNEEKKMFLDIACFFIGEDSDTAIRIWDGSGWNGWLGLFKLQNRYLIELDSEKRITMHNHMRDLGRYIAEKQSPHRVWRGTEDLLPILFHNFHVRGIDMVHQHGSEWPDPQSFKDLAARQINVWFRNITRLQLLRAKGDYVESIFSVVQSPQLLRLLSRLVWLSWDSCPCTSLPAWVPLQKLRVLEIKGSKLETLWPDEYDQAPLLLRELIIDAPLSKIPKSIGKLKDLEKLVLLRNEHVEEANLKTFLDELCHLKFLRFLVLWKCSNMKSLPDSFVNLTNLEHLDLSECSNLQKLPSFFRKLPNLELIDLSGCDRLNTFPPGRWRR